MAMTEKKIVEALDKCIEVLKDKLQQPKEYVNKDKLPVEVSDYLDHCYFMAEKAKDFLPNRREKLMRWLGFIQGVLWTRGIMTIEELKNMNKPDEVK